MRVLCLCSFPTAAERAFTAAGFAALVRPTKKAEKRPTITDDEGIAPVCTIIIDEGIVPTYTIFQVAYLTILVS